MGPDTKSGPRLPWSGRQKTARFPVPGRSGRENLVNFSHRPVNQVSHTALLLCRIILDHVWGKAPNPG